VDASGAGSEIECPACHETIVIPQPPPEALARQQEASLNPIASSAAAKEEKHFKVPAHAGPTALLIKKANKPLEFAAKDDERVIRIKTVRRADCVELGKDNFDQIVSDILQKIGQEHIIAMHPLSYTHLDATTQKFITDYGVMIVFKG